MRFPQPIPNWEDRAKILVAMLRFRAVVQLMMCRAHEQPLGRTKAKIDMRVSQRRERNRIGDNVHSDGIDDQIRLIEVRQPCEETDQQTQEQALARHINELFNGTDTVAGWRDETLWRVMDLMEFPQHRDPVLHKMSVEGSEIPEDQTASEK